MNFRTLAVTAAALLTLGTSAHAVTASDTQDLTSFGWGYDDFDYQHGAIWGTVPAEATLTVTAKDVDSPDGEVDQIFAFNVDTASWVYLGDLAGTSDTVSDSVFSFSLAPDWHNSIASGLKVSVDRHNVGVFGPISSTVTAVVPEPETYAMLMAGLGAVGFMARRRKAQ